MAQWEVERHIFLPVPQMIMPVKTRQLPLYIIQHTVQELSQQ